MTAEQVAVGIRRMLRRIRSVMSGAGAAQERLDDLVRVIAGEMVAEVCTVYVMRAGEVLELFATQGLNPSSIHVTRLRVGEGLIGEIGAHARVLNLSDAPAHPQFAYRPETGEDPFRSFLGAPIVRGGRVRGVIAVQNVAERVYSEEEVEALEMIAVVLGELIAGGDLVSPEERISAQGNAILPLRLTGVAINAGLAMGVAVLHQPRVSIPQMFADDTKAEQARLRDALSAMHRALDDMFSDQRLDGGGEHREVLETFRLVAEDRGWLRRMAEAIDGGLTAEAAVQKVQDDMRTRMRVATDPYLRERLYDFEDLGNRLMQHLSGDSRGAARDALPDDVVLIARNMGPAELLDYEPRRLRALVLEEGTAASHVAIVARALDIPVVGRVPDLLSRVDPHDPVVVDGDNAQVFVRPNEDVQQTVAETIHMHEERRRIYRARRNDPPMTMDGERISLNLNAGLLIDVQQLADTGADGIGLYRTEIPFMVRSEFPSVESQRDLYASVLNQADGKPVMFRTLDIGGDKQLSYFHDVADKNPFMGWRAIRVALDRPSLLRHQLRALISAAKGGELSLMFPMVSEVAEFEAARNLLEKELARAEAAGGILPAKARVGAMLEVPALLWQMAPLLRRIDFLSVGSNDLFQFLYAVDRGNPRVSDRYDVLAPGVLRMLRDLARQCRAAGVPLSLCGEMAGHPLEAMTLIGLGFRSISMTPARLGAVRAMTRTLRIKPLAAYLDQLLESPDHSLRGRLRAFARDHGVTIDEG
jgi:phosphotransferase system enzyme I (PtsP)